MEKKMADNCVMPSTAKLQLPLLNIIQVCKALVLLMARSMK